MSENPKSLERCPDGSINNCAAKHGEPESSCQVCAGRCPDRVDLVVGVDLVTGRLRLTAESTPTLVGSYVLHVPTGVCGTVREVWPSGESGWLWEKGETAPKAGVRKVTAEDMPGVADFEGRRFVLCTHPVVVFDSGHKLLCRAGEESSFQALTVDERIFFELAKDRIRRTLAELCDMNEALRLAEKRAAFFCALALRDVLKL